METLAIVAGEPFAQVFRPLVTIVVDVVNAVLGVFRQLPAPVKRAFAAFVVGAGATVALVGALISAKAGLALLAIGLKAVGLTLGGVMATILPAVLLFGALALAVAGLVVAFRRNVGGVADFFERVGERISLAFHGLVQLFEDGGFSGAVREELGRAGNQGMKDFLINVFLWVNRVRSFFSGVAEGFTSGIEVARPTIEGFVGVLRQLGTSLGFLSERDDADTASSKFRAFGVVGERVGRVLAVVFELLAKAMTVVGEVAQGMAEGWQWVSGGADVVRDALAELSVKVADVTGFLFGGTSVLQGYGSAWRFLGSVIAFIIGAAITLVGLLVAAVTLALSFVDAALHVVVDVFNGVADIIDGVILILRGSFSDTWGGIWAGMKLVAFGAVEAITGVVLGLAQAIAGVVDGLSGLFGGGTHWQQGIRDFREAMHADLAVEAGVQASSFTRPPAPTSGVPGILPADAVSTMPSVAAMTPAVAASFPVAPATPASSPPVVVQLQVDGQTLATAVHRADRDSAGRSFSSVPAY
jgi:hypothetical protein